MYSVHINSADRLFVLLIKGYLLRYKYIQQKYTIYTCKGENSEIRKYWQEKETQHHFKENRNVVCLAFNGKQGETLIQIGRCRRIAKEKHYALLAFPGNRYIDNVVPQSSKAADVSKEILSVIIITESSTTLQALICDKINNNTGKNNGIIRKLETRLL